MNQTSPNKFIAAKRKIGIESLDIDDHDDDQIQEQSIRKSLDKYMYKMSE